MSLLLDTNICIAYLNGSDDGVCERLLATHPSDVRLCSVVKGELLYGARHSRRVEANLRRLAAFFQPIESLPFDDDAAHWYGVIRSQLQREGRLIGGNDLLIAAIARANDATLVTRNDDEFRHVVGLAVETW